MNLRIRVVGSLACVAALSMAGCEPENLDPSIAISYPRAGTTVTLGVDGPRNTPVAIEVKNFTLKPAGECAGAANCGHVVLKIDGDECNPRLSDGTEQPFNNSGSETVINAKFATCIVKQGGGRQTGSHTITVELRKDDGSAVNADGSSPSSSVTFNGVGLSQDVQVVYWPDLVWNQPVAGLEVAAISGSSGKPEWFVQVLRAKPFYRQPIHWHPSEERLIILKGRHFQVLKDTYTDDPNDVMVLDTGDFVYMPAGPDRLQYFFAGAGGCMFYTFGIGPKGTTYKDGYPDFTGQDPPYPSMPTDSPFFAGSDTHNGIFPASTP